MGKVPYRLCSRPPHQASVTMTTLRQTNQPGVTARFGPYLPNYIILIRPQQTPPLENISFLKPILVHKPPDIST